MSVCVCLVVWGWTHVPSCVRQKTTSDCGFLLSTLFDAWSLVHGCVHRASSWYIPCLSLPSPCKNRLWHLSLHGFWGSKLRPLGLHDKGFYPLNPLLSALKTWTRDSHKSLFPCPLSSVSQLAIVPPFPVDREEVDPHPAWTETLFHLKPFHFMGNTNLVASHGYFKIR